MLKGTNNLNIYGSTAGDYNGIWKIYHSLTPKIQFPAYDFLFCNKYIERGEEITTSIHPSLTLLSLYFEELILNWIHVFAILFRSKFTSVHYHMYWNFSFPQKVLDHSSRFHGLYPLRLFSLTLFEREYRFSMLFTLQHESLRKKVLHLSNITFNTSYFHSMHSNSVLHRIFIGGISNIKALVYWLLRIKWSKDMQAIYWCFPNSYVLTSRSIAQLDMTFKFRGDVQSRSVRYRLKAVQTNK